MHIHKLPCIFINYHVKKPKKFHENLIPTKVNNHTIQYSLLHNNKHKHTLQLDTCSHIHELEYNTMGHIATHTFKFKIALVS